MKVTESICINTHVPLQLPILKNMGKNHYREISYQDNLGFIFRKPASVGQTLIFSLVQFSRSVMSDSLQSHGLEHSRPPCPLSTPGVHSNSCPSSWWCHPTISSSVVPFSSCPQSLSASESFPMSQLFAWGGQSTGVSASASFPLNFPVYLGKQEDWLQFDPVLVRTVRL